ncbi:MAG TPA: hypothetical protein VGY55_02075 [Pirellulales bacterium]|jgi:hypothetical protein|nr:hypothetical protein [Pirellulales bacterium]
MKLRSFSPFLSAAFGAATLVTSLATPQASMGAPPGPIYAQLSSSMSQKASLTGTLVTMDSNDALGGLDHDDKGKGSDITIKTEGVYFMVAAIQVAKEKGDADDYIDVWMKQNGKDVDNSGCRQIIKDPNFTTVLVCQGIAECKAGDKFNVVISSNSPDNGVGIVKIAPKGEPAIPSIIFSIFKIN